MIFKLKQESPKKWQTLSIQLNDMLVQRIKRGEQTKADVQIRLLIQRAVQKQSKNKLKAQMFLQFLQNLYEWKDPVFTNKFRSKLPPLLISCIKFSNLQQLQLIEADISSIQFLNSLQMPNLKSINFEKNSISSLRSLNKCNFHALNFFQLNTNKFNDGQIQFFNRMKATKMIWLQINSCIRKDFSTNSKYRINEVQRTITLRNKAGNKNARMPTFKADGKFQQQLANFIPLYKLETVLLSQSMFSLCQQYSFRDVSMVEEFRLNMNLLKKYNSIFREKFIAQKSRDQNFIIGRGQFCKQYLWNFY